jgi:hypothetical protein
MIKYGESKVKHLGKQTNNRMTWSDHVLRMNDKGI